MKDAAKIRTAIVGCGMISETYLANLAGPEKRFNIIKVVACCDVITDRMAAKAEKYALKEMTLDEICGDPGIDLVINLTDPAAHYPVIRQLILAGKNVFTEKVLSTNFENAMELVKLADERGVYLGAAPDTFLGASAQTARQLVESGLIGEVTSCHAFINRDHFLQPEVIPYVSGEGGGIGFDVGIYYVTALASILGPAKRACGFMRTRDTERRHILVREDNFDEAYPMHSETLMTGALEFANGVYGTVHFNADCIMNEKPQLMLCGTQGIIYMGDPNQFGDEVKLLRKGCFEPTVIPFNFGYKGNCRGVGASEMAWAIRRRRNHRASKEMALHALEMLYGIARSGETGTFYEMKTTFEKQPPLAQGYLDGEYYDSDPEMSLVN